MKKRIIQVIAYVMSSILAIGLFTFGIPQTSITAKAVGTDKDLQLGTSVLGVGYNNTSGGTAATVYFDNNKDGWYVIGYDNNGVASDDDTITLLAKGNLGNTYFDTQERGETYGERYGNNVYENSLLKVKVDEISERLTDVEETAVISRNLVVGTYTTSTPYCDGVAGTAVDAAVMWPLSPNEAYSVDYALRKATHDYWWLR